MKPFLIIITGLLMIGCTPETAFERSVVQRANQDPATAPEYFMQQIESGASTEEQAVYLYGIGLANENLGNVEEAVNDYLGAEILGYAPATEALQRARKKIP